MSAPDFSVFEPNEPNATLTLEKLARVMDYCKQFKTENPFVEMGRKHGFALDLGDLVIVPRKFFDDMMIEARAKGPFDAMLIESMFNHKAIRLTNYGHQIFFIRKEAVEGLPLESSPGMASALAMIAKQLNDCVRKDVAERPPGKRATNTNER